MNRITGLEVPAAFPPEGPVAFMLFGEAPGPRGADRSGIPFWGDRAGLPVYRVLERAGLAQVPAGAFEAWDGAALRQRGLAPRLRGVALSNALARCPSSDGQRFRAPTDRELTEPGNLQRLQTELARAADRCPARLQVIALGRRAAWVLGRLPEAASFDLHARPHPSAQGLLQAAPDRGKGLRLADLQAGWEADLLGVLVEGCDRIFPPRRRD